MPLQKSWSWIRSTRNTKDVVKTRFWLFYGAGFVSSTSDARISNGCHGKATKMCSRRSTRLLEAFKHCSYMGLLHVATCSVSSTRSRACFALWFSCQDRARIAHGSSILRSCSLAVTLIITKEIRCLPPLFKLHGSSIVLFRLGIGVLLWFSISFPRPVAVHCLCS